MKLKSKITELEAALDAEEKRIKDLFRQGCIPAPSDYASLDQIKKDLKTVRRIMSIDSKRTEPKLTRKVSVLLSVDEFKQLSEMAEKKGVILSKYIRELLKKGLKVEEEA